MVNESILLAFRVSIIRTVLWVIRFAVESQSVLYNGLSGSAHSQDRRAADAQGMLHFRKIARPVEHGSGCCPTDNVVQFLAIRTAMLLRRWVIAE